MVTKVITTAPTQVLTSGASSVKSTAFLSTRVRIATTAAIYINVGPAVSVTATTSNLILPANAVEVFSLEQNSGSNAIAVLQVSATGAVSITPVD